ncbi:repressor LexA [Acidithiobacillus sp. CV18-2]|uniref:LexA repressor n=1 Tax=Igneacidithiobacillus copahuensis TaxID=2724909 RepID=A0AAE2YS95_9PROT|nr:repressor LexA [Acidithiobacillus sp. CV18-3]MBU2757069.1 repressor LexA [Acidithiobacillus sp. BN09-2]MBU2778545.1 repressor LexA [Acidithiobacillus sp. CV18-2]MBU2789252.1 repressor LexA [Igneacidithiobacillus copahuensis]MBU2797683.1 repressor LexA [Acidithiobacillus sp. VAN18-2]MBU2798159.1 repressor LexA [Acidithiobacillus sp. VAN18-4]UTV82264.1 transcriptional repressor LexA [Acidithiobacillus sp. YTS05]
MEALTRRQQQILLWIQEQIAKHGLPPTRAELQEAFHFRSPNAAESHVRTLARKGYLVLQEGRARGIRLVSELIEESGLPLIGRVPAGAPILAEGQQEGCLPIDPQLFPGADYLLRVQGMSMRDAGILDGDILAVQQCSEAHNGQVVVARVDGEVTVKRWRKDGYQVFLLPENPDFSPIEVDLRKQDLRLEGLVVGLLRLGGL